MPQDKTYTEQEYKELGATDVGAATYQRTANGKSSIRTSIADGLNVGEYDYVGVGYPNSTTETYTFKVGGSGGTTVATVTVVYTDSSKDSLSSVTKS